MKSIFETKSGGLLDNLNTTIAQGSIMGDETLQSKLENALFKMELMDYALNETMIVALTNRAGQILYVNDRFVILSGYEKEELLGKTHRVINSKVHPESFFQEMWKTILSGQVWTGEICNKKKNGEFYWVKTYILPIQFSDKETYFLSVRTDITSEKEKERLLQNALLSSFEAVVNHVNNLVFQVSKDMDGNFGFSLFSGKMAQEYLWKQGLPTVQPFTDVGIPTFIPIADYLPTDMTERLVEKLQKVFLGEKVSYKEWFDDKCVHITLSPYEKEGKIIGAIGFGNDITELESTRSKLAELAYYDHLTNSFNTAALERDVYKKTKMDKGFSFFYIDLDRFKNINDSLGHVTGDELLKLVSKRIRSFFGDNGTLYRIGGDEFVVLLDSYEPADSSLEIAELLIQEMEFPFLIDEMEVYISCSIGISHYPSNGSSYQSLHRAADLALNTSKEYGKRNAVEFNESLHTRFVNKVQLESDIRAGLEKNEFFLEYQPKVHVESETVRGYEALIRWNKKGKEIIPPNDFIAFAEETGLIIPLGRYVFKEACKQAVKWLETGVPFQTISINISPAELEQMDFLQNIQDVLQETGLPTSYLELEITENVLMKNVERLTKILKKINALGIRIAMDDFGSGFSNFRYLSELPIHTLKIDQMFMNRIVESRDEVIVSSIIRIGLSLGLEVVAEGVETKEMIHFLREHNCQIAQGYYYSKPLPADLVPTYRVIPG